MPRLFWILCSAAIGIAIIYLSLTPGMGLPGGKDKIAHLAAYLGWTSVSLMMVRSRPSVLLVIGAMLVAGAAIEIIQPYVGRYGSLADMATNSLGVAIGTCLAIFAMWPADKWVASKIKQMAN